MSDVLILTLGSSRYQELEEMAKRLGFRVKTPTDLNHAKEWLKLRTFSALIVDTECSLSDQEQLANLLWNTNPSAPFIVCSPVSQSRAEQSRARLFGAELVHGPQYVQQIEAILVDTARTATNRSSSFPILVVEDLESPRDIICVYLESLGFNDVSGVASAGEALALLEENPTKFSCVVTDIRMPQVSGAELIKKLRSDKRFSSLPIVVLTAYGTVDCLLDCLRNGASGFLVKPPKKSDMIREMGRAIRIRESGRHARLASAEEVEYVHDLLEKRGLETE